MKNGKLILVWVHETEKWHYFMNEFNPADFVEGFVDYEVDIENGYIVKDSYKPSNVGKLFDDCYSNISVTSAKGM